MPHIVSLWTLSLVSVGFVLGSTDPADVVVPEDPVVLSQVSVMGFTCVDEGARWRVLKEEFINNVQSAAHPLKFPNNIEQALQQFFEACDKRQIKKMDAAVVSFKKAERSFLSGGLTKAQKEFEGLRPGQLTPLQLIRQKKLRGLACTLNWIRGRLEDQCTEACKDIQEREGMKTTWFDDGAPTKSPPDFCYSGAAYLLPEPTQKPGEYLEPVQTRPRAWQVNCELYENGHVDPRRPITSTRHPDSLAWITSSGYTTVRALRPNQKPSQVIGASNPLFEDTGLGVNGLSGEFSGTYYEPSDYNPSSD